MNNGLGYKLANVPTITGLSTVTADEVISESINTDTLILNGIDVSNVLTGISYSDTGGIDLTTIDNNVTITSGKKLKSATVATANDDVVNKLFVDNALVNITGISYSNTGGIDLTTIDNNVTITSGKKLKSATVATANDDVVNKLFVDTAIVNLIDGAPATLDTLNELAAALADDPNFATTITALIAGKVSLTGNETIAGDKTFTGTMIIQGGHNWRVYSPALGITSSITLSYPFYQVYPINTASPITITLPTITSAMVGAHFSFKKVLNSPVITFNIVSGGGFMPFNSLSVVASVTMSTNQVQTEFICNGGIYYQVNTDLPNYVSTDTAQTISAIKTFTAVPLCATAPTTANMLCNKTYVDSIGGSTLTTQTTTQPYYLVGSSSQTTSTDTTLYKSNTNVGVYVNPTSNVLFAEGLSCMNSSGSFFNIKFNTTTSDDFLFNNTAHTTASANKSIFQNINFFGATVTTLTLDGDGYASSTKFSVGAFTNPVVGNNAGFISQNIGSSATVIQNQATSGKIFLNTVDATNTLTQPLQISSTDLTTITTNCPTITGFTAPLTTDNTSKIATTSWVQSTLSAGVGIGATTIAVADNNTATTMYPVFTTTGAGQKSLLFDITTSPLSYTPNTGTLRALIYNLSTTVASELTASGTTITLSNNNIGGTYNFTVSTSGIPLTILSLNETNSFYRVPFYVSTGSAPSSTDAFQVLNSASLKGVAMLSDATLGAFNSLVAVNDSVIYGDSATVGTANLTLTTWSNTTTGVRLTPTSALIGAGGAGATPTAYVSCSGTTVSIIGNPTVSNRNIIVDNAGSAITIGNGASTATANIIMTKLSAASATVFTTGGNTIIGQATGNALVAASSNNTLIGASAGLLATGNGNTCIGVNAGSNLTTGIQNICIGVNAAVPTITNSNQIVIGSANETQFIQGQFNWRVGTITATGTLPFPYSQFYTISSLAATTVTLQNPSAAYIGTHIMFKRRANTQIITFTTVGAGLVMMGFGSVALGANVSMSATQWQCELICDGTNWYQFNMT